jgi:hypothetical protein
MLFFVTKYNFDTLHGIYMNSFTVFRALASASAYSLPHLCSPFNFYVVLFLSYTPLFSYLSPRLSSSPDFYINASLFYIFHIFTDPYRLTVFPQKKERLRCHHHHYISFFWCSSFASFSQSFLLFCVDLMFVISPVSCIFTSFRVVCVAWGFVQLLLWKSRFWFRMAFILYRYGNRNTDFWTELMKPVLPLHCFLIIHSC